MGVRFPSVSSTTIVTASPAQNVESVLCTTPPLTLPLDFSQVIVMGYLGITTGAGTTNYAMRIRRGTTTSGQVLNVAFNIGASASTGVVFQMCYVDTPGAVGGQQYSLTYGNTATGAAAVTDVCLIAFAL